MNRFLSNLAATKNKNKGTTAPKAHLGLELLEDRLVQSTFSYMSLTESASLSTVTSVEASYSSSITAVEISTNHVTPVQLVQPMHVDGNTLEPVEGFQPLVEIGVPEEGEYTPIESGVIHIQTLTAAEKFAQGKAAIQARLGEAKASEVFGTPLNDAYVVDHGHGVRRDFTNGSMLWSQSTGAHFMSKAIMWKYDRGELGLFYPKEDTKQLAGWQPGSPRGAAAAMFNDLHSPLTGETLTVVSSPGNVSIIRGTIRGKWRELGAGRFGVPLNDGFHEYGGQMQTFWFRGMRGGDVPEASVPDTNLAAITWHKDTGTHVVVDWDSQRVGTYTLWAKSGRASAYGAAWGFPTQDQFFLDAQGRPMFTPVTEFVNPNRGGAKMGAMIATHTGNPDDRITIHGAIYSEWRRLGGANFLGYPVTQQAEDDTHRWQFFRVEGTHRATRIEQHKATGQLFRSTWVESVEGEYVKVGSSQSSGLTVEDPTLESDTNVVQIVTSYRAPVIIDGSVADITTSFIDAWSARLSATLDASVSLFGEERNGVTLDADTAVEDGAWFTPATTEESEESTGVAEREYAVETEMFQEPLSEEVIDEVFAEVGISGDEELAEATPAEEVNLHFPE